MLLDPHDRAPLWFQCKIPTVISLAVITLILAVAIAVSLAVTHREQKSNQT